MCNGKHPRPEPGRAYIVWTGDVTVAAALPCGCVVVPKPRAVARARVA